MVEFREKGYRQYECPNNLCRDFNCFKHCKSCGNDIKWFNEQGDPSYRDGKRMVFDPENTEHRCKSGRDSKKFLVVPEDVNKLYMNEYITLYRLRNDSGLWGCSNCKKKADIFEMKEHWKWEEFRCYKKWSDKIWRTKPSGSVIPKKDGMDKWL